MEEQPTKGKHGGARPGAGRKKTTVKHVCISIPQDVADILEGKKLSAYILEAIRFYAKNGPKDNL